MTRRAPDAGMTLVEVIVATAVFAVASLAAAHLLVWATRTFWAAGSETIALAAAQSKLEELQSLAWHFDPAGRRVSDFETNLAGRIPAGGGPGLSTAPANALLDNVDGYVDFLDAAGSWIATGPAAPADAAYVRRWAVRPLVGAPEDMLVLQVVVMPVANGPNERTRVRRAAGEAFVTSARTRIR